MNTLIGLIETRRRRLLLDSLSSTQSIIGVGTGWGIPQGSFRSIEWMMNDHRYINTVCLLWSVTSRYFACQRVNTAYSLFLVVVLFIEHLFFSFSLSPHFEIRRTKRTKRKEKETRISTEGRSRCSSDALARRSSSSFFLFPSLLFCSVLSATHRWNERLS